MQADDAALLWYFQRHMASYRRRAVRMQVPCTLEPEWLLGLFKSQGGRCFYTGTDLIWNTHGLGKNGKVLDALSVDRRDPTGGYTPDNVVLCTVAVNTAKGSLTDIEFYKLCAKVLRLRNDRELEQSLHLVPQTG